MDLVCISDTHGKHREIDVPNGDVLVHAGDITLSNETEETRDFVDWLFSLPHKHKVVIAGNHDRLLESIPEFGEIVFAKHGIHYLNETGVEIEGRRFYGSPWSLEFMDMAFNANLAKAEEVAFCIPSNTDVLISHGPPLYYGDCTYDGKNVGCPFLLKKVKRIQPRVVVCGHIHEAYGLYETDFDTRIVNACSLNLGYEPVNRPIVVRV